MRFSDIVAQIPPDELDRITAVAALLTEVCPTNEAGERMNWFEVIVRDWWEKENTPPYGWFQWWDD